MKKTTVRLCQTGLLLVLLFSVPILGAAEQSSPDSAPVAVMPETTFEFPPVIEGESVTHDFIIQNRGNAVLNVPRVKTS